MKYKIFFVIILILAFIVRLVGINHFCGLNYDELYFYDIISNNDYLGVIKQLITRDYHPFLYLFVLKFWTSLFGYSDGIMQLLSVLFSLGSVWLIYLIAKTYKNKTLALLLMALFAFSFVFIDEAKTVRFYQMAQFLALLNILFSLKLIKNPKRKHYFGLIISSTLLIYTQTTGVVFVGIGAVVLFLTFCLYDKKNLFALFKSYLVIFLCSIFQFIMLFIQILNTKQTFWLNPWEWSGKIVYRKYVLNYIHNVILPFNSYYISLFMLSFILITFIIYQIYRSYKENDKQLLYLSSFFGLYIFIYYLLQKFDIITSGKNVNYFIFHQILFFFVVYIAIAKVRKRFLVVFLILNMMVTKSILNNPNYIFKNKKIPMGIVSVYINKNHFDNCMVFNLYGDDIIKKYAPNYKYFGLDADKMFTQINWQNEIKKVYEADFSNMSINDKKEYIKNYIIENDITNNHRKLYNNRLKYLNKGEYFIITCPKSRLYPNSYLIDLISQDYALEYCSLSFLVFSKLTQDTVTLAKNDPNLKFIQGDYIGNDWVIFIFKKVK